MQRRPIKTFFSGLGIAMAVAVLILGSFALDAIRYMMDFQFRRSQRQDLSIAFMEPLSPSAPHEIDRLTGVMISEPFRAVPVRLRSGHYARRVAITGLDPSGDLFRLMDVNERPVSVPARGLLMSDKLAELLHVQVGNRVEVQVLEGERPRRSIPVSAIITEYGGTNAYMNRYELNRMLGEDATVSGAFLKIDSQSETDLYRRLKQTPAVASVIIKSAALRSFEETVGENILTMRFFNIMFATVIAFGVVYNNARISLSEQSRELATLRVIGFTRREVSAILLGELALLTAIAIPFGWLLGYGFAALSTLGLDTEIYRIPLVVGRSTFAMAAITVVIASIFSGLIVRRRIDHLDLVAVLKTKE
jgi:putative ABC transport system permease protein